MFQDHETFHPNNVILRDSVIFNPLIADASNTLPLAESMKNFPLAPSTPVLVFQIQNTTHVLSTVNMIYHHVAQGTTEGIDWIISFCVICNSGVCFSSVVNGEKLDFVERGLYNAMTILGDKQTDSLWHHITGRCLSGAYLGQQLRVLSVPLQMTLQQAIDAYPDGKFIYSILNEEAQSMVDEEEPERLAPSIDASQRLLNTIVKDDTRLPRFELGLGVWTETTQRFYPLSTLHSHNNAVLDTLGGRRLLVYIDPHSSIPCAVYTEATEVTWQIEQLFLNTGERLSGTIYTSPLPIERPLQLFQRWYSFATVFPQGQIALSGTSTTPFTLSLR